jgi:SAM-dependent methyltransferase
MGHPFRESHRERLRTTFGEDAERYDRARPGYPAALFDELGVGAGARVLEIGCGTGQATRDLARLGCSVVAVELSADMAAGARRNLASFASVEIVVSAFEDWPLPAAGFDLALSATAFHWIDPEIRMIKAVDSLRVGGAVALVFSSHIAGGTAQFFVDVQRCYERFDPDTPPDLRLPSASEVPMRTSEFERSPRLGPVSFHRYEWDVTYSTSEYLDLLLTYSNHRALPAQARDGLLTCIGNLIDRGYGGAVTKRYLTELAIARREA